MRTILILDSFGDKTCSSSSLVLTFATSLSSTSTRTKKDFATVAWISSWSSMVSDNPPHLLLGPALRRHHVIAWGLWPKEPFYLQASKLRVKDRSSPIALPSAPALSMPSTLHRRGGATRTSLAPTCSNLKTSSQNHGCLCLSIRTPLNGEA